MNTLALLLLAATTAAALLGARGRSPPVQRDDETFLSLAGRRGLRLVRPLVARGTVGSFELVVRAGEPGLFLSLELWGGQPERLRLKGRPDDAHPVLRALGPAVSVPVGQALDIDATLSHGMWLLNVWEPLHAAAADRLLQVVLDAASALAELPAEAVDRALVAHHPDPAIRRLQLSTAIAHGRADVDWLLRVADADVPEVALTAAAATGEAGRAKLLELLADPYVAERAALALSFLAPGPEQPRVEALLLLGAEAGDVDALDALARYGTIRVVPSLHALAERLLGLPPVARHARRAIDAIRLRAGEPGRLSLADLTGGELSVADPVQDPASTP